MTRKPRSVPPPDTSRHLQPKYFDPRDLPLVEVEWEDAAINVDHTVELSDQADYDEFGWAVSRTDIGYLVDWNPRDGIKLAVSTTRDKLGNSVEHSNVVPNKMIRRVVLLGRTPQCLTRAQAVRHLKTLRQTALSGSSRTSSPASPSTTSISGKLRRRKP